jgi:hypothetical protein
MAARCNPLIELGHQSRFIWAEGPASQAVTQVGQTVGQGKNCLRDDRWQQHEASVVACLGSPVALPVNWPPVAVTRLAALPLS